MTDLRHAQHRCERCPRRTSLTLVESVDEYLCEECAENVAQNLAEAAWERHAEDFHDGGSTRFKSLVEQQAEAKKLK